MRAEETLDVDAAQARRVDAMAKLLGADITDEMRRYVLYRLPGDGADVWMIDDLRSDPLPFDQGNFEKALMSYLQ